MKHILYTISLLVLLGACTDEAFNDEPSAGGGKPVPVNLSLNLQPLQSPLDADTKAGSRVVSSTEVCKGMEISLVKTPVAPETRAADMKEVKNFWVFQFNGMEPTSELIKKKFHDGNSVKTVTLTESAAKNRIIVIANADEATFNGVQLNTTLDEFNKLGSNYNDNTKSYFPLFKPSDAAARPILAGSTDIIVTKNSQADIMLYRSTAKVTVNLNLGIDMKDKYMLWTHQFMSVPLKSFYHSIGRVPAFPGVTAAYGNYDAVTEGGLTSSSYSTVIEEDLPVNLHDGVPFTTPEKRVTNAPANSTYLQIMGASLSGGSAITKSVVYQIHLGSNFTDDYSVSPNYHYTYNITITGENDDDSRVIKFIPGYFGGQLKKIENTATPDNPFTWKYEKRIEVYIKDVTDNESGLPSGTWVANSAELPYVNSFMDGWQNTWDMHLNKENFPAIRKCIDLNGPGVAQKVDLKWYTPSFGQALGIYVSGSNTLKTLPGATYWTSTTYQQKAWGLNVWTGMNTGVPPTNMCFLRCIKDINPGETVK